MQKIKRVFQEPGFHVLMVLVFLLLFGWPFLAVPGGGSPQSAYYGLLASWAAFIVLLFLISRD